MDLSSTKAHQAFLSGDTAPAADTTPAPTSAPVDTTVSTPSVPTTAPATTTDGAASTPAASTTAPAAVAAAGDRAKAAATAAGATPAQAEAAKQRAIEGLLDGKPFEVPRGLQLPYIRGGQRHYRPVEEVLRNHINHADYQEGKQRLATLQAELDRRDREAQLRAATMEQREKELNEEHERFLKAAAADPDSPEAAEYRQHLELMRTSPDYRKRVEDSRKLRERELADTVNEELSSYDQATSLTGDIAAYCDRIAANAKYEGLDGAELAHEYGQLLKTGELRWPDPTDPNFDNIINGVITRQVLALADRIVGERKRIAEPYEAKLAEERRLREAAEAALNASSANGETRRQIARSQQARAGAPAGGAPPAQGGKSTEPPKPFMGGTEEAEQRRRAWVQGG